MSDTQNINRQHEGDGAEQQVERTRFQYDYDDLIKVVAGVPENYTKQFQVHKDTICKKSNFFKAAVSTKRWLEGQNRLVNLPDFSPVAVNAYIHWVYSEKVLSLPEVFWQQTADVSDNHELLAYVTLYLLADYLDDNHLRVAILDTIITKLEAWKAVPGSFVCQKIWEGTPKGSPLRSVVLEWLSRRQSPSNFAKSMGDHSKDFLEEMAVFLIQRAAFSKRETPEEFAARVRAQLLSK